MRCLPKQFAKLFIVGISTYRVRSAWQIITSDCVRFCGAFFHSRRALAAESLFPRKQTALFQTQTTPRWIAS